MSVLISVIIAAKNEEKHISEAIISILSQKNIELELIFVDDGSEDSTVDIVSGLSTIDSRLKVYKNNGKGKVSAFCLGYSFSKGDYVALFAGDDIMPVDSLYKRYSEISKIENPAVLISKIQVISDDKKIDGILIPKRPGKGNPSGASLMLDRSAAGYLLAIPFCLPNEDTWMDLCIRYIKVLNIKHSDVVACNWRVHSGNSMSIKEDYNVFSEKFSRRMYAYDLFKLNYLSLLSVNSLRDINNIIKAESFRKQGRFIRVIFSRLKLSDKIRFVFYSNKFFFGLRKKIRGI